MKILKFFEILRKGFEENHKIADVIFTIIILFVSTTSFFHVMEYWTLTNKWPFYVITAIATELVIIGSMLAIRYTWVAWLPFILGVLVQGIGNIFYSYLNIDVNSDYFKAFQELFQPLFQLAYGDELVVANYKRVLAYSNGAFYLSPIVFLWAKMALKNKVQNAANADTTSTTPNNPPSNPEPPITDGDEQKNSESPIVSEPEPESELQPQSEPDSDSQTEIVETNVDQDLNEKKNP